MTAEGLRWLCPVCRPGQAIAQLPRRAFLYQLLCLLRLFLLPVLFVFVLFFLMLLLVLFLLFADFFPKFLVMILVLMFLWWQLDRGTATCTTPTRQNQERQNARYRRILLILKCS